ncbi:MAG: Ppx/GppA family phosphatase [Ignavibacteriae bacterium]|nr:Ppx/GppA family phosphatase [Ignavibacteriota bacterium]
MSPKIAAIDIGTNSFHLIIAYLDDNNKIQIVDSARKVLRLNSVSQSKNIISQEAIDEAVAILNEFVKTAKLHKTEINAVATSAVREAENKLEFVEKVHNSTGIKVNVIDGQTEARLILKGVQRAISFGDRTVLCTDIGGGSTEFIVGKKGKVLFAQSIKLGAVRLTKMFFLNFLIDENKIHNCEKYVTKELLKVVDEISKYKIDLVVGSSGTIKSVALMKNVMNNNDITRDELNGEKFSKKDLESIRKVILNAKTLEERKQIKGLEEKRADVIPAGVILLSAIFKMMEIQNLTVSSYALREGIVVDSSIKN